MALMMSRGGARHSSMLAVAGARLFSAATARAVANEPAGASAWTKTSTVFWVQRGYAGTGAGGPRSRSTVAFGDHDDPKKRGENGGVSAADVNKDEKGIVSYWGVPPSRITKEDGTEWKWSCFRPWETYKSDVTIDLKKHHAPTNWMNERMHLMTFMEVAKPKWYERALVMAVQGVFFNAYFVGYLISPKFAHRMVGYLEEEAIHSYTEFLKELDNGNIENVPAPAIAIDYWQLPANATLRDVVVVVRADEAHHRDVNHFASDIHYQGRELKDAPAPLGYH